MTVVGRRSTKAAAALEHTCMSGEPSNSDVFQSSSFPSATSGQHPSPSEGRKKTRTSCRASLVLFSNLHGILRESREVRQNLRCILGWGSSGRNAWESKQNTISSLRSSRPSSSFQVKVQAKVTSAITSNIKELPLLNSIPLSGNRQSFDLGSSSTRSDLESSIPL